MPPTTPDRRAETAFVLIHRPQIVLFQKVRKRFRKLFRATVSTSVTTPAEVEDELRHVVCALIWEQP